MVYIVNFSKPPWLCTETLVITREWQVRLWEQVWDKYFRFNLFWVGKWEPKKPWTNCVFLIKFFMLIWFVLNFYLLKSFKRTLSTRLYLFVSLFHFYTLQKSFLSNVFDPYNNLLMVGYKILVNFFIQLERVLNFNLSFNNIFEK